MCKGLAVVVEKIDNEWKVYSKEGESSHDALLHELRDDLRYGKSPHLKFEVIFPNRVCDDIVQEVDYPEGWTYIQFGKKIACADAFFAVFKHLYENPNLLNFTPTMLQEADLREANLSEANLRWANLIKADLIKADLRWANLSKANLSEADLSEADLSEADLRWANLIKADLIKADLREANLRWANLSKADLREANLRGSINTIDGTEAKP